MEAQRGAKYDDDDDDKEDEEEETVASVSELLKAGTLFLRLKLYSKASKCFALATQRSTDDDFRPWYNLGLSQSCAGEVDGARAAYLTALEKAPECPEAHLNLAALQMKVGELEEAEKHLRKALKTAKAEDTRKHAAWNYGSVLRQQGRHAEAVSFERERLLETGGDTTLPKVEPEEQTRHQKVHLWCVKWGTKYDAEYVNKLFRGVSRHLDASIDFDFHCLTDDAEGVDAGVLLLPLNTERKGQEFTGWWGKLHLFSADLPVPRGSRMVYLDLDTVLCGDISQLAVLEAGGFCTLRTDGIINERRVNGMNTSVMLWRHGELQRIFEYALRSFEAIQQVTYKFDHFMEMVLGQEATFLQDVWPHAVIDYHALQASGADAKIVIFPLEPKPHQLVDETFVRENWI